MFTEKRSGVCSLFSPPQIFIETTETQLTQSMLHLNSRTPVLPSSRPQCVLDSSNSRGQTCKSELPRRRVPIYQVRVLIIGLCLFRCFSSPVCLSVCLRIAELSLSLQAKENERDRQVEERERQTQEERERQLERQRDADIQLEAVTQAVVKLVSCMLQYRSVPQPHTLSDHI